MARQTKRRRPSHKKTKKQRGGVGKLGNMGAFGSLFAKRGTPPPTNAPPANIAPPNVPPANDPLAKYRKMIKMGQPEGAVIQKMLTNGKNPKNIFPSYAPASVAPVVKAVGFTLDELKDLKDYVNRSEIVVRMKKSGLNPNELYPELSSDEITTIIDDYSKPRDIPAPVPVAVSTNSGKSMKNALFSALKGRTKVNGVKQNISFFTTYTPQEETDLNTIDSARKRIKEIDLVTLPAAKKSIKQAEDKGQQIKDFQLKAILALLKEKRDLDATVANLLTDKLKKKVEFVTERSHSLGFTEDKSGPLPKGWKAMVNSSRGDLYYRHKYTGEALFERPTEEAFAVQVPEGWTMEEDEEDAWYINQLTGKSQWELPTEPPQLFNTTGYEQYKGSNGAYVWQKPVNGSDVWFELRNSEKVWYENPTNYQNTKFNSPDGKMIR